MTVRNYKAKMKEEIFTEELNKNESNFSLRVFDKALVISTHLTSY